VQELSQPALEAFQNPMQGGLAEFRVIGVTLRSLGAAVGTRLPRRSPAAARRRRVTGSRSDEPAVVGHFSDGLRVIPRFTDWRLLPLLYFSHSNLNSALLEIMDISAAFDV
jgi:hypothetical protein